jgi:hypothetical protein
MRLITAISTCALLAIAVPAFAQNSPATSGPGTNSSQPGGDPGATGGTDPKNGGITRGMTEGRSSAQDTYGNSVNGVDNRNAPGGMNNGLSPGIQHSN